MGLAITTRRHYNCNNRQYEARRDINKRAVDNVKNAQEFWRNFAKTRNTTNNNHPNRGHGVVEENCSARGRKSSSHRVLDLITGVYRKSEAEQSGIG